MKTNMFTLRELGEAVAKSEGRKDQARVAMQLKGLAQRGILQAVPNAYGPRGVYFYTEAELVLARLMMAALDLGFRAASLGDLKTRLQAQRTYTAPNGAQVELGFAAAMAALGGDAQFQIEVSRIRQSETGEILDHVLWLKDGNRYGRPDPLHPDAVTLEGPIEAVVTIPFTRLCAPLVAALRQIGERWE